MAPTSSRNVSAPVGPSTNAFNPGSNPQPTLNLNHRLLTGLWRISEKVGPSHTGLPFSGEAIWCCIIDAFIANIIPPELVKAWATAASPSLTPEMTAELAGTLTAKPTLRRSAYSVIALMSSTVINDHQITPDKVLFSIQFAVEQDLVPINQVRLWIMALYSAAFQHHAQSGGPQPSGSLPRANEDASAPKKSSITRPPIIGVKGFDSQTAIRSGPPPSSPMRRGPPPSKTATSGPPSSTPVTNGSPPSTPPPPELHLWRNRTIVDSEDNYPQTPSRRPRALEPIRTPDSHPMAYPSTPPSGLRRGRTLADPDDAVMESPSKKSKKTKESLYSEPRKRPSTSDPSTPKSSTRRSTTRKL
ncbi:hypothetical protein HGRIS_011473 [Hohenbuehelia grisea]